jgi:hypothetical protein
LQPDSPNPSRTIPEIGALTSATSTQNPAEAGFLSENRSDRRCRLRR